MSFFSRRCQIFHQNLESTLLCAPNSNFKNTWASTYIRQLRASDEQVFRISTRITLSSSSNKMLQTSYHSFLHIGKCLLTQLVTWFRQARVSYSYQFQVDECLWTELRAQHLPLLQIGKLLLITASYMNQALQTTRCFILHLLSINTCYNQSHASCFCQPCTSHMFQTQMLRLITSFCGHVLQMSTFLNKKLFCSS